MSGTSERRKRIERSIQRSRDHPVEPGKCCAMCIEVGCEKLENCICKPLKFAWYMGKETGKCCAECAKKIREKKKGRIHISNSSSIRCRNW